MKIFLATLFLFMLGTGTYGQPPDWVWAESASGIDYKESNCIAKDSTGNIIIAGRFRDSTFEIGSFNLLHDQGSMWNSFVAKYDQNGNVFWAKSFGGGSQIKSITTDENNNIYAIGYFVDSVVFFDTIALLNIGNNWNDLFFIKMQYNGDVVWAKGGGYKSYISEYAIHAGDSGYIYIGGEYADSSVQFGNTLLANEGADDVFLVKYDTSGNVMWANHGCSSFHDEATSIGSDDSGNVYLAGYSDGEFISFGGTLLSNFGAEAMFIVKYDCNGNYQWAHLGKVSSDGYANALSMFVDNTGNSTITGFYDHNTLTFDNHALLHVGDDFDKNIFIVKFDRVGNDLWAQSIGDSSSTLSRSITCDSFGNCYFTGYFGDGLDSTTSFGASILTGVYDIFVSAIDNSGNILWATSAKGTSQLFDEGTGIQLDSIGNLYLSGNFRSSPINFGSIPLTNNGYSIFLSRLSSFVFVKDNEEQHEISVFPNPASEEISIYSKPIFNKLEIYDALGQVVLRKNIAQSSKFNLSVGLLNNGIYFIKIFGNEYNSISKLIIEHE